jgi:hypothetical protein
LQLWDESGIAIHITRLNKKGVVPAKGT